MSYGLDTPPRQQCDASRVWRDLAEKLDPFAGQSVADLHRQPGDVAARMGKARSDAQTNRIAVDRNDRDRFGQLGEAQGLNSARRDDHVRMRGDRGGG
jgi:hypothetical protein